MFYPICILLLVFSQAKRKHSELSNISRTSVPEKRQKKESTLPGKGPKKEHLERTPQDVFNEFQPFSVFLTKVKGIEDKFNSIGAFSLNGRKLS